MAKKTAIDPASLADFNATLRHFVDELKLDMEMVTRQHGGERVLVVAHQVIVNCMRYLVECLDEEQILAIDRLHHQVPGGLQAEGDHLAQRTGIVDCEYCFSHA